MVAARLRTWAASWSVARWSWASTASWGDPAVPGEPRPPPAWPVVTYLMVSSRSACRAWTRLVILPPSRENCSTRW